MNKLAQVSKGEIYAIPLFVSDKADNESFAREKFNDKGKNFVFGRIIEDLAGGGILIEIFDLIGAMDQDLNDILTSKRLFDPISVSGLGIYKKRWKKIYTQKEYDQERDSKYSEISLVAGTDDNLQLWRGGKQLGPISEIEAKKYEPWTTWRASHLEKRILRQMVEN